MIFTENYSKGKWTVLSFSSEMRDHMEEFGYSSWPTVHLFLIFYVLSYGGGGGGGGAGGGGGRGGAKFLLFSSCIKYGLDVYIKYGLDVPSIGLMFKCLLVLE